MVRAMIEEGNTVQPSCTPADQQLLVVQATQLAYKRMPGQTAYIVRSLLK